MAFVVIFKKSKNYKKKQTKMTICMEEEYCFSVNASFFLLYSALNRRWLRYLRNSTFLLVKPK